MMVPWLFSFAIFSATFFGWATPFRSIASPDWVEFDRFDGITMYRREIPGSDLLAYKGVGVIRAPMGKVFAVVQDTAHWPDWVPRNVSTQIVRVVSPSEQIQYALFNAPWPVADRDFFYRVHIETVASEKRITLVYESIDSQEVPEVPGRVRAWMNHGTFSVTPTPDGKFTQVEAEVAADPRGLLPKWIVNLYQRSLPRQSLEGLMKEVSKPGLQTDAWVESLIRN